LNINDANKAGKQILKQIKFMSQVEERHFQSATDFLNAVAPRSATWERDGYSQFIFRGVGDADNFDLIPAAFRESFWCHTGAENPDEWNNLKQICGEWRLLREFFEIADNNGLPLPEDSQKLREAIEKFNQELKTAENAGSDGEETTNNLITEFPRSEFLTLFALAQHHGLPTRLLDWSRSVYSAAYFAATSALKIENKTANLAVWALRFSRHDWTSQFTDLPLQIITAPNTGNDNLKAQRGLFTLYRPEKIVWNKEIDRRPFDEIALEIEGATFYRFTLPITEAGKLLYLLSLEGVTGATMFPNYDGVVKTITEARFYNS
jgi:hypothetical protein